MKKLENKVAVVIGGNSGIGLATAKKYAEQGAKVAITGRNKATVDSAVIEIGHGAIGIVADISKIENINTTYEKINEYLGNIDVLVVNAGPVIPRSMQMWLAPAFIIAFGMVNGWTRVRPRR